jgi:hypothetical protein
MKKLLLLSALLFTFSNFYSQISIEESDYIEIGDEIKMIMYNFEYPVKTSDIITSEMSFSEYPNAISSEFNINIFDPALTDVNGVFTNATFAYQASIGLLYCKVTNNKVELLGFQGSLGEFYFDSSIDYVFPEPVVLYNFPLNYQDANESNVSIDVPEIQIADIEEILSSVIGADNFTTIASLVSAIKISFELGIKNEFDEFGTINFAGDQTIINGSFSYLREKRTYMVNTNLLFKIANTIPIYGGQYIPLSSLVSILQLFGQSIELPDLSAILAPTTIPSYSYWTKAEKYPLVEIILNSAEDTIYNVSIRSKDGLFNNYGTYQHTAILKDVAFPNPADNFINFDLAQYTSNELNIYSLSGTLLTNIFIDEETIEVDISNYSSGTYFYKIIDKTGYTIAGGKFIKE